MNTEIRSSIITIPPPIIIEAHDGKRLKWISDSSAFVEGDMETDSVVVVCCTVYQGLQSTLECALPLEPLMGSGMVFWSFGQL